MPLASPFSIRVIISLNTGLPGILADCFSTNSSTIDIFSRAAYSRSSASCDSIDNTCISSTSVDLRAYRKNGCGEAVFMLIQYIKQYVKYKYGESMKTEAPILYRVWAIRQQAEVSPFVFARGG